MAEIVLTLSIIVLALACVILAAFIGGLVYIIRDQERKIG